MHEEAHTYSIQSLQGWTGSCVQLLSSYLAAGMYTVPLQGQTCTAPVEGVGCTLQEGQDREEGDQRSTHPCRTDYHSARRSDTSPDTQYNLWSEAISKFKGTAKKINIGTSTFRT